MTQSIKGSGNYYYLSMSIIYSVIQKQCVLSLCVRHDVLRLCFLVQRNMWHHVKSTSNQREKQWPKHKFRALWWLITLWQKNECSHKTITHIKRPEEKNVFQGLSIDRKSRVVAVELNRFTIRKNNFTCIRCLLDGRSGWTHLVAQRQVLAVLVGQSLGLLVMLGELHRSLTALGQQRSVGQERLLLPRHHVDAIGETILLQQIKHPRPELSLLIQHQRSSNKPSLLWDFIFL